MAIELKEIQDAVEEGVKVLKQDWEKVRDQDQKAFDAKVLEILSRNFEGYSSKDEVEKNINEVKEAMQKQFDLAMTDINEKTQNGTPKIKSFGQSLMQTLKDEQANLIKNINEKSNYTFNMKDFNYDNFPGYEPFVTEMRGIRENPAPRFHWRNVLLNGRTSKELISYPKVGTDTGAPGPWEYGDGETSKPEFAPNLTVESNKIEWIAGIIKNIPISMIEDLPWLQSFLGRRAERALLKAEDSQIWNGNGTSPQLDGLKKNSTLYDGTYTNPIEIIVDAAARQIADTDNGEANFAVISNTTKVGIILNKSTGSGEYNLPEGSIGYVNGQLVISGLNVYSNAQMATGELLIGDRNEAEFVLRSAPRLRWFDQNEDDATRNVLMLRIEERAALAVYDPTAFVRYVPGT